MRRKCLPRLQLCNDVQSLIESEMRGVGLEAHGIEYQDIEARKAQHRVGRDEAHIGDVRAAEGGTFLLCGGVEAIGKYG